MSKKIPFYKSKFPSTNLEILFKGRIKFFSDVTKKSDTPLTRVKLGKRNLVVVNSAEAAKHFFIDNYKNYEKRTNMTMAFGRNIFTTSGDEWVSHRRPL